MSHRFAHSDRDNAVESTQLDQVAFDRKWDSENEETVYATADLSKPHYTLRIKDMPECDRPRDRLLEQGAKVLSNAELLSILLKTGERTDGLSALGLAQHVLNGLATDSGEHVLSHLRQMSPYELMAIPGIGPAKASTIVAAIELGKRVFHPSPGQKTLIEDPSIAASLLSHDLMWEAQEKFALLFLDIKHRLMSKQIMTIGTPTETLATPRDIFGEALRRGAMRIIAAHNHPTGALEPSSEDLKLTQHLIQTGQIVGVPLLDHLILGNGDFSSLRQMTELWTDAEKVYGAKDSPP